MKWIHGKCFSSCLLRLRHCDRGGVLAEYAILTLFILLPIVGVSVGLINPSGAIFTVDGTIDGADYGLFGNAMVAMFRRIMCGLTLPIP